MFIPQIRKITKKILIILIIIPFIMNSSSVFAQDDYSDPGNYGGGTFDSGGSSSWSDAGSWSETNDSSVSSSQGYSVQDNVVSFDSSVSGQSVSYSYSTGFHSYQDQQTGAVTVEGPAGTVGVVTENGNGTFTVSFESPQSNVGSSLSSTVSFDIGNDGGGGNNDSGDTVSIDLPTTDFQCQGCIPPTLYATPYCTAPGQAAIQLNWTEAVMGGLRAYYLLREGAPNAFVSWWAFPRYFTDIVAPNTVYYYRVFGANGDDGTFSSRTPLSNLVGVLTPNCSPPGAFTFTQAAVYACLAPSYSTIYVSWTPAAHASYYLITPVSNIRGAMPTINTGTGTALLYPIPAPYTAGEVWTFTVTAINGYGGTVVNGSYSTWVAGLDCEVPSLSMNINGKQSYDLPLAVKQKDVATLTWSVSHANSCTASPQSTPSDPNITPANLNAINNAFTGVKALTGSASIPTLDIGTYRFTLACTNSNVPAYPASTTSTLIVNQLQKPYIQTTGGDVHTNETIFISQ